MKRAHATRRQALQALGSASVAALSGCGGRGESTVTPGGSGTAGAVRAPSLCVVRPQQTAGPYFVDELLERVDIRSDPADGSLKEGVPLRVVLRVNRLDGSSCEPLTGAMVDLWQCDALGVYSGVVDSGGRFDTRGQKFLRGFQLTNAEGVVEFTTIYPGWYDGRTVHLHFGVRTQPGSGAGFQFVSQLYFDQVTTDRVLAQSPYDAKGGAAVPNVSDGIFQSSGGGELMLSLSSLPDGYLGMLDLALLIG